MANPYFLFFNLDILHKFFFFLGTNEGTLFKRFLELVIFTILSYMIISEYIRDKRTELKFLIAAFMSLMMHRFITVLFYTDIVFGHNVLSSLNLIIPVALSALELFTIMLLVNAFLYPIFSVKPRAMVGSIKRELYLTTVLFLIVEIGWVITCFNGGVDYNKFWGNIVFVVFQLVVLVYALYLILTTKMYFKYKKKIYVAFFMYAITPFIHLINFTVFSHQSARLAQVEHPFPFISIIIFTQVIYLKLVDKAYLKKKLRSTEAKYKAEKELSELKDEFVSTVSHELKTPLTSIKLYLSLLKNKKLGKVNKKQKEAFGIIDGESNRLTTLINDILNLSKLESGKEVLNLNKFDLSELNNPIYFTQAVRKGVKVNFDIPPNFIVNVDPDKFKQVFINLVSNAVKFTDAGGRIDVKAVDDKDKRKLIVKDTGCGMDKVEIPKLFDKFYQVGGHMTRKHGGSGLGLAIVKQIIDLHKGKIEVHSEIGKGSEFRVIIPK